MPYRIPLPRHPGRPDDPPSIDILNGADTAVQRALRRGGLAAFEPSTDAALLALFEISAPGFTFFDVGANVGIYGCLCALLADPAHVVAFEPTPSTAAIARRLAAANGVAVTVEEVAVGRRSGRAALHLSDVSDASNSLVAGFKPSRSSTEVDVVSIDEYVDATGRSPDVIKIDTETFEPEVIAGARRTIAARRPALVVEVLNRRGHDHGEELMAELDGLGYSYYRLAHRPDWSPRRTIRGKPRTAYRDWLLVPGPVSPELVAAHDRWAAALERCTPDRNPRHSRLALARSIRRTQGNQGLMTAVRNHLRNRYGAADQRSATASTSPSTGADQRR